MKKIISLVITLVLAVSLLPMQTVVLSAVSDTLPVISMGYKKGAAIKTDGSLWVWDSFDVPHSPTKRMENVVAVGLNGNFHSEHIAVVKADGSLWFGYSYSDQFLENKILDGVKTISLGPEHGAAIKTDDSLWMWGSNSHGQLGDGTTEDKKKPVKIMDNVVTVSVGGRHSAAIKSDGTLWTWGAGSWGQLGLSYADNRSPLKVMDDVAAISLGEAYSAAIKTDGSLWTWGSILHTTTFDRQRDNTPDKIMDNVAAVSIGYTSGAAIKTDGSLWLWGNDNYRSFGMELDFSQKPIKVMDNVAAVSLGTNFSAAVKTDGSLWTWGDFRNKNDGKLLLNELIKVMHLKPSLVIEGENTVQKDKETTLKATRYDENGNVAPEGGITWSCSDESVAQITPWGNNVTVKGLKGGKATITATHAESGQKADFEIEVQQKEIRFSKIKPLKINGETIITASIYDGDNLADEQGNITFKIEDTSIAKITDTTESTMSTSASATIKGLKSGVTKIIATDNENDLTGEATILVGLTPNIHIEANYQKGDYGITKLNFTVENKKYDNLNYDELSQEDIDSMSLKNPTVTTHLSKGLYATSGFGHTSSYETNPSIDSSESLKPGDKRKYSYDVSFGENAVDNDKSFAVISVSGNNIAPVNKAVNLDVDLPIKIYVNGTKVEFDAMPILESGRTLVPVRKIFNALGASDNDIHWDGEVQKVTATVDGKKIELQINSTTAYVNGESKTLDVPARILSGNRTYVPVRFIAESFGAKVMWKGSSYTVNISTGDKLKSDNESVSNIKTVSDSSESGFTTEEKNKWLGLGETYNIYNGGNISKGVYQVENLVIKEEMHLPEGTTINVNGYLNIENKITFSKNSSIVVNGGDINVKKKGIIDMSKGGMLACDGNFVFNSGTSHKNYLTDGIIKVGGDVELKRNFVAGGKNEFHITNSDNIHIIDVKDDGKQTFSIMRVIDRGFEALDIKQEFDCAKSLIFEDWSVLQPYLFSNLFSLSPMDGKKSSDDIVARVETGLSRAILEESKDVANLGDISNVTNNMKVKAVNGDFEYLYYDKNSNSFKSYTLDVNYTGMDTWGVGGGFGSVTYTEGGKTYKYMIGVSASQVQDMFTSFKATVTANLAQGVLEAYVSSPSELKVNNAKNIIKSMIMDHFSENIQTLLEDGEDIKKCVKKIKEINDLLKMVK